MPFGILKLLPQDYAADVYHKGEARGGDFALSELPHPECGLYLSAKVWFFFEMAMASYYSSEGGGCPIGVGHDGQGDRHDGSGMCTEHPVSAITLLCLVVP